MSANVATAAVLEEGKDSLVLRELLVDDPAPDEVLISTAAAGLCHTDLQYIDGIQNRPRPIVLGHESSGVVKAVGDRVTYVKPGDHVVTCLSSFCGSCEHCLIGLPYACLNRDDLNRTNGSRPRLKTPDGNPVNQFIGLASFSDTMLVHQNALVRIDREIPLEHAALLGCGVTTGFGAVTRTASIPVGATAAVIGCGGVGLSAVMGAVVAGASEIIAVDTSDEKLEAARQMGATVVINASTTDPVETVRDLTGGGVEYSFEAVGTVSTAEQAFAMLKPSGTCTVIGFLPPGSTVAVKGSDLLLDKRLLGCRMGSNRFRVDIPRYVNMYLHGTMRLEQLVTHRVRLEDINAAYDEMRQGKGIRSVIAFGDD